MKAQLCFLGVSLQLACGTTRPSPPISTTTRAIDVSPSFLMAAPESVHVGEQVLVLDSSVWLNLRGCVSCASDTSITPFRATLGVRTSDGSAFPQTVALTDRGWIGRGDSVARATLDTSFDHAGGPDRRHQRILGGPRWARDSVIIAVEIIAPGHKRVLLRTSQRLVKLED
jgi:hypothetical protein